MSAFKPLSNLVSVSLEEELSDDAKYWKNFEFPVVIKKNGPIRHVEFSPKKPYNFLATSANSVALIRNIQPYSEITNYRGSQETAYSGSFRPDGELVVSGSSEGNVLVYRDKDRLPLRKFVGHTGAVQLSRFLGCTKVFSGGDDQIVKVWDLADAKTIVSYNEHKEYVRCGSTCRDDIFVTGSYDGTVKLFDIRCKESVATLSHNEEINDVIIHPSGGMIISAGVNTVKIWSNNCLLETKRTHNKSVTALGFCSDFQRFASASLDKHIKIYEVATFKVVHSMDYPEGIVSFAISPDDRTVVTGMKNGLLSIQRRKEEVVVTNPQKFQKKAFEPAVDDVVVLHKKKPTMDRIDRLLKKFKYTEAFKAAMEIRTRSKSPETTFKTIKELIRRRVLANVLAGGSDKSVADILKFLIKNFHNRVHDRACSTIYRYIKDLYGDRLPSMVNTCKEIEKFKAATATTKQFLMRCKIVEAQLKMLSRS